MSFTERVLPIHRDQDHRGLAGTLIAGMLFEGWPARLVKNASLARAALLGTAGVIAVVAGFALRAITQGTTWSRDPAQLWVAVTGLNFIGDFVIVHAAAFRRWPFPVAEPLAEVPAEPAAKPHATELRA